MTYYISNLEIYHILFYVGLGFVLYFFFKVIKSYIFPLLTNKESFVKTNWLKIQIIAWFSLSLFILVSLLKLTPYITLTFLFVILALGWDYWRNVFSGIVLKFNDELAVGEIISTNEVTGTLIKIGFAETKLQNNSGEIVTIPNLKIKNAILKKISKDFSNSNEPITIHSTLSAHEIYRLILACPYVSGNKKIEIKSIDKEVYSIKMTLLDIYYKDDVKLFLERQSVIN